MDQTAFNIIRYFVVEADFFSFYGSAEEILAMVIEWLKAHGRPEHLFFILPGARIPINVIRRAIRRNKGKDVKIDHLNRVRLA
jgi:hypothetical protein